MAVQIESKRILIEERARIAGELHDCVSQHLFSIIYAIQSMTCGWEDMTEEQKLEQIKEIQAAASTASGELRAAIHSLSSPRSESVSGMGAAGSSWLGAVRSHLASQAKLSGVQIDFQAPQSVSQLPVSHQKALYRIVLEGVGNAIRHGGSSWVNVCLTMKQGAVKLTIEDNGTGFDVRSGTAKSHSGFGLGNMRALAGSLGGTFEMESRSGIGTRILVWLPRVNLSDSGNGSGQTTKSG